MSGCLWPDCPTLEYYGIHANDRIDSRIVAQKQDGPQPSCGALGDLSVGSTIGWTAVLQSAGEESCGARPTMTDVSVADVSIEPATIHGALPIQLASGCRGQWNLWIRYIDPPPPEAATWALKRTFYVAGDASPCFPMNAAPPKTCEDTFVLENTTH